MGAHAGGTLFDIWLTGWSICRGYALQNHGNTVSVHHAENGGWTEHFLAEPDVDTFRAAAEETRADPGRTLTIVTTRLRDLLPLGLSLGLHKAGEPQSLMSTNMMEQDVEDPRLPDDGLALLREHGATCRRVTVNWNDEHAASGAVTVVADAAVYDGILTAEKFRRRGLATYVMRALTADVLQEDVRTGLLLASPDGRALYEYLGWEHQADVVTFERRG